MKNRALSLLTSLLLVISLLGVLPAVTVSAATWKQATALKNLHVTAVTNNSVTLSWNKPSVTMTNFNGYIKKNGSFGSKVAYVTGTKNSLTIKGLSAGVYYTLGIKGWNTKTYKTTNLPSVFVRTKKNDNRTLVLNEIINQRGSNKKGNYTDAEFGCGGTCLTMLMNSQKNAKLYKDDVLARQYSKGWFNNGNANKYGNYIGKNFSSGKNGYGTCLPDMVNLAKSYGYTAKYQRGNTLTLKNGAITQIDAQLNRGHLVIVGLKLGYSTYHYEVVYGKDISGNYLVANPYGKKARSGNGYSQRWSASYLYGRLTEAVPGGSTSYVKLVQGILWLE